MKSCRGCKYLSLGSVGGPGYCRWLERHGHWTLEANPYTGNSVAVFHHADGRTEAVAVWRPLVEQERAPGGRCGPDATHYEPNWWRRLMRRLA